MTKRVVTCSSWREAAADQADEFLTTLFGWLVVIGIGVGAMSLWSGSTPSGAPQSAQSASQKQEPAAPTSQDPIAQTNSEPEEDIPVNASPSSNANRSCWLVPLNENTMQGESCIITKRVNANGHTVYALNSSQGLRRTIVLWNNASAEVIQNGAVEIGSWQTKDDGNIWVSINGQWFGFEAV